MKKTIACLLLLPLLARAQDGLLPVYVSPIDVTRGRVSVTAFAPERNTGVMTPVPIPPDALGPRMRALTSTPLGVLMDARWNGTPAEQAAGRSPRQQACDGPNGVRAQVRRQAEQAGEQGYDIACNFGTTGEVFVRQSGPALFLSYQVLNNTATFRTTSSATCHPDHGTPFCPNDPSFEVRFAFEMLTTVWTQQVCTLRAEQPVIYLHAVQIESNNVAASLGMFIDSAFKDNRFMAGELAMQARETRAPISLDDAFAELRGSPGCAAGTPAAQIFRTFSQLETHITLPAGIELRAVHPPIPAPRIQNVSLPYGVDTCQQGFVWREAYPGDHVCVTPATRSQAAADNAQADARRARGGGLYGPNTCRSGFVWREANVSDLVCVTPAVRAQTKADNAAAATRFVLQEPSIPSFTRPQISAPPIVAAGASFTVNGNFFPRTTDPTTIQLFIERDWNSVCFGGATELETQRAGGTPALTPLPATTGSMSSCNYRHDAKGLQTGTQYRFRVRDCDPITCSPWSNPFTTLTGTASVSPPVALTLDNSVNLGSSATNATGTFQATLTMPANTAAGTHTLTAASGTANDSVGIQVTGGRPTASLTLTGSYFGETGCPMHPVSNVITTVLQFPVFGAGFAPGPITLRLDSASGVDLGTRQVGADGTFCAWFIGPPTSMTGSRNLVGIQGGAVRASLPVQVKLPSPIN